jgi:hypothetical protein
VASVECVLFTEAYLANAELVQPGAVVFAEGHVDHKRGEPQIVIRQIHPPGQATARLGGTIEIDLEPALKADDTGSTLELVSGLLKRGAANIANGNSTVEVSLRMPANGCDVELRSSRRVVLEPNLIQELRSTLGRDSAVRIRGRRPKAAPKKKTFRRRAQN